MRPKFFVLRKLNHLNRQRYESEGKQTRQERASHQFSHCKIHLSPESENAVKSVTGVQ